MASPEEKSVFRWLVRKTRDWLKELGENWRDPNLDPRENMAGNLIFLLHQSEKIVKFGKDFSVKSLINKPEKLQSTLYLNQIIRKLAFSLQ